MVYPSNDFQKTSVIQTPNSFRPKKTYQEMLPLSPIALFFPEKMSVSPE